MPEYKSNNENRKLIEKIQKTVESKSVTNYYLNEVTDYIRQNIPAFLLDLPDDDLEAAKSITDSLKILGIQAYVVDESGILGGEKESFEYYYDRKTKAYKKSIAEAEPEEQEKTKESSHIAIQESAIKTILNFIKNNESFLRLLRQYQEQSKMTQVELAAASCSDRHHLNKILNGRVSQESISKDYIIKLSLGMKLSLEKSFKLLMSAGYFLCDRNERDKYIIECISQKAGLINTNIVLYEENLNLL